MVRAGTTRLSWQPSSATRRRRICDMPKVQLWPQVRLWGMLLHLGGYLQS